MLWFILGLLIGGTVGVMAMCMMFVASRTDEWEEKNRDSNKMQNLSQK